MAKHVPAPRNIGSNQELDIILLPVDHPLDFTLAHRIFPTSG